MCNKAFRNDCEKTRLNRQKEPLLMSGCCKHSRHLKQRFFFFYGGAESPASSLSNVDIVSTPQSSNWVIKKCREQHDWWWRSWLLSFLSGDITAHSVIFSKCKKMQEALTKGSASQSPVLQKYNISLLSVVEWKSCVFKEQTYGKKSTLLLCSAHKNILT